MCTYNKISARFSIVEKHNCNKETKETVSYKIHSIESYTKKFNDDLSNKNKKRRFFSGCVIAFSLIVYFYKK
jgi:hypothetical protein